MSEPHEPAVEGTVELGQVEVVITPAACPVPPPAEEPDE